MSPADRARAKHGLIGLAVVGGVALVGAIAVSIVGSAVYSPEKQAEAYLDAIVDTDLDKALAQAPVDEDEASTDLLTNEIYAATHDRITGYEITDVDQDGDSATITVDLEGIDDGDDVELTMESDGGRAVFFNDWKVADGGLAREVSVSIPDDSSTLTVDGGTVPVDAGEDAELWALPGSYAFNPYGDSEWLEVSDVRTIVTPDDAWGLYAEIGEPEPSEALKDKVDADLEAWLTTCMASTEADPTDCPQDIYLSGDERKISWTLTTAPTISWDNFSGTFPTDLSTDTDGEATVTYEEDASYGFGKAEWVEESDTSTLYFTVGVDLVDGEPVVSFDSY